MHYNLFITLKDLETDLVPLTDQLQVGDIPIYEQYKEKIISKYGYDAYPYVTADPYYTESERHTNHRFFSVMFDDNDRVGCFIKYFKMYGNHGSYLWFKPISLNDNIEHEKLVMEHLSTMNISYIEIPEVLQHIDYTKLHARSDDYYVYVPERAAHVKKSKYRGTKGINKLEKEYGITVQVNKFNPDELHYLCDYWWRVHKKNNRQFSKEIDYYINLNSPNVTFLTYYLENKLVGFSIITSHFNGKVARIQHNRNIINTKIDFTDDYVKSKLGHYMHYYLMKFLNANNFQYAYIGDALTTPALKEYKRSNFNHRVVYHDLQPENWEELFK